MTDLLDNVLQAVTNLDGDIPVHERTDTELLADRRSPEATAEWIDSLIERNNKSGSSDPLSLRGRRLRDAQLQRAHQAHLLLAELGPYGVAEIIAERGIGGAVDWLQLPPVEFRAWIDRALGSDIIEMAEHLYAEKLLAVAATSFDDNPDNKIAVDLATQRSKMMAEIAGLYNRQRGRAAPKIDVNQVHQQAVSVSIYTSSKTSAKASDKEKAARQVRVANARVAYGSGMYEDPPGLAQWISGELVLDEGQVDDYLMLRKIPEQARQYDVVEAEVVEEKVEEVEDLDQALETLENRNSVFNAPGVFHLPEDL